MHQVGLKQAEVNALVELRADSLQSTLSTAEKNIVLGFLLNEFEGNPNLGKYPIFTKLYNRQTAESGRFDLLNIERKSGEWSRSRSEAHALLSLIYKFLTDIAKDYDPMFETDFAGFASYGNCTLKFRMILPPVTDKHNALQKKFKRRFDILARYVRKIQNIALAENVPISLEVSSKLLSNTPDYLVSHRLDVYEIGLGFTAGVPVNTIEKTTREYLSGADPLTPETMKIVGYSVRPISYYPLNSITKFGFADNQSIKDWKIDRLPAEKIATISTTSVVFFAKEFVKILHTVSRLKTITLID